jgi:hypothetical protein
LPNRSSEACLGSSIIRTIARSCSSVKGGLLPSRRASLVLQLGKRICRCRRCWVASLAPRVRMSRIAALMDGIVASLDFPPRPGGNR